MLHISTMSPAPAPAADWERLRPVLDDAMHALDETLERLGLAAQLR